MKDKQFKELLEANGALIELGNDLVASIQEADWANIKRFKSMTPHMITAIYNWKKQLENNYTSIK